MQNLFYLSEGLESLFILLGVLGLMGIIVVAVIIFKKKFKKFDIEKPNISEEQAVREELDRVLVPVDEDLVEKTIPQILAELDPPPQGFRGRRDDCRTVQMPKSVLS